MTDNNEKASIDELFVLIADYVCEEKTFPDETYRIAKYCLFDAISCTFLAYHNEACQKLLSPYFPVLASNCGAKVLGMNQIYDPMQTAFYNGILIRWLDFNDTWLAKEWGHPSDNLGAILAIADYLSRNNIQKISVKEILYYLIKAYEIQGNLALTNSFNAVGLDHVILVKVASAAVITHMLGGDYEQIIDVLSQCFVDGNSLRTYRHAPNTGSRKSWAAGDACSRAVFLASLVLRGEQGYDTALSAKKWGFEAVFLQGDKLVVTQPFNHYVVDNILFKISYPAEFHSQTALEATIQLYPIVKDKWHNIDKIVIDTHESAVRIISKTGPLHNASDRDHCLQYIVAIGLIYGTMTSAHYQHPIADNALIDELRGKMVVQENKQYSRDYLDSDKRSIANSVQIFFLDGTMTEKVEVHFPIGHKKRRKEGLALLEQKLYHALSYYFDEPKCIQYLSDFNDDEILFSLSVEQLLDRYVQHD